MMRLSAPVGLIMSVVFVVAGACTGQGQVPDRGEQIAGAVVPLPDGKKKRATVLGWAENGELVTVREGSNEMVCLADEPGDDRFHAACYHESLSSFMRRGRELRAEGYSGGEVDSIRQAEIDAGEWSMPDHPASLYTVSGPTKAWNAAEQTFEGGRRLYVVYAPYETAESTGLPTRPSGGGPWLMEPGKPWAHIMISGK